MVRFFSLLMIICGLNACYYDVEEEIYGNTCVDLPPTYSQAIVEILRVNCYQCHSAETNFGNVTLEGYDELRLYVFNGSFIGSMDHQSGFIAMPQDRPKMLDCDIDLVKTWIAEGGLNN